MEPILNKDGHVLLRVRVQPRASRDALRAEPDGRLRVALTAPPVEGAANEALCAFIARRLDLPKGRVAVAAGRRGRDKTLSIAGVTAEAVAEKLGLHGDDNP